MAKPTYEELEQRIKGLEEELDLFRDTEKAYLNGKDILKVLNLAPYGLFVIDLSGKVLAANKSGAERLGKTVQEIVGTILREYFPPDESENRRLKGIQAIKSGKPVSFEDHVEGRWFHNTIFPISDKVGKITRLAIYGVDVTEYKAVEKALRENEALLNKSQAIAHIGSWELDVIANQLTWSDGVYLMFGLRPQEFEATYEAFLDTVHPDDRAAVDAAYFDSVRERRDTYEIEHRIIRRDSGEIRAVHEKCEHIKDSSGRIVRSIGMVQDITERARAEEALQAKEARFRNLAELLPETVFETDEKGNITYVNQKAFVHFMYTQEDFDRGLNAFDMIAPEDCHRATENFQKIVKGESLGLTEYTALRKDGSTFPAIFHSTPIIREGKPAGLRGFIIDISERKRAEELLKESEEFLQNVFNAIRDGISVLDLELNIIRVNPWMEKVYAGQAPLAGKKCYSVYQERDTPCPWCPTLKTIETGETHSTVVPYPSEENQMGWIDLSAFPLKDGEGNVVSIIEYVKDITEQKNAEEALIESEKKYRALVEESFDGIFIQKGKKIVFTNACLTEMLGYGKDELLGMDHWLVYHPDYQELTRSRAEARMRGDAVTSQYEVKLKRKDGSSFDGEVSAKAISFQGEPGIQVWIRDIDERKRMEEALKRDKERFRVLTEESPLGLALIDNEGSYQYINPKFSEILGYTLEDIPTGRQWFRKAYPDEKYRKQVISTWIEDQKKYGIGEARPRTYKVTCRDGSKRTIHFRPVTMERGDQLIIYEDITETQRLEEQLRQAQKMEAIGTLAGGIAHDFNNILASIIGYAEIAGFDVDEESKTKKDLNQILNASYRAKDLVKHILAFSRLSKQERIPVQMKSIVKETIGLLRASLPVSIEIRQNIESNLSTVEADPTQIQQIIMNLCTNARHAMMEEGGILEISLSEVELDYHTASQYKDLSPGKYVRLTVSDTGIGMDKYVTERIFDPYFTTKEKGVGTGLGLSVVQGIVKSYSGQITVYSEPGKGTTFHVYIPAIQKEMIEPKDEVEPLPIGTEHILFIDDDPSLVDIGRQMLERLGYDVTTRTSSIEALELFKAEADRFDLVITDMTMPHMTGDKLAMELMQIRPAIPVIICTGFSEVTSEEKAKKLGIKAFAMKPLVMRDLANMVRKALGNK